MWGLILLAVVAGLAITLQGQFTGQMEATAGVWESVFVTFVSGALVIALVLAFMRGGKLGALRELPPYVFSAGLLGLFIVGTIAYIVPRLGLVVGFSVILLAQYSLAALIDQFGWFGAVARPLETGRLLGLGVMALGVWLVVRSS